MTVETELFLLCSSRDPGILRSCSFPCLNKLEPNKLEPGFTEAGLPKLVSLGLLPNCHPKSCSGRIVGGCLGVSKHSYCHETNKTYWQRRWHRLACPRYCHWRRCARARVSSWLACVASVASNANGGRGCHLSASATSREVTSSTALLTTESQLPRLRWQARKSCALTKCVQLAN